MYKLVRNCLNDADKTELNNLSNNFIFLIFYIHQVLLIKSTKTLHSSGIFQSSTLGHIQTMGTFLILLFSYTYKKNWVQWTLLMMDMRMPYYGTWMDFQVLMKYQWTCVCSPNPLTTPHSCQKCFFVQVNSGWIGKWHNTSHEDTKAGAEVVWQIPFNTH